jgi:hypothetical protein
VGEALRTLGVDDNVLRAVWEDRLAARPPEGALSAFRHLLQRLAVHRPVVVVAEEAGWDDAPLGLAQNLLLRRRPLPVLLVVAVRVVPGDLPLPAIDALERAGASVLAVAPPSAVEARRALAHVAPVVHSALDALIGSAGGDPSVALARLGAFHRAGRVLATPKGLRLRPGSLAGAGAWDAGSRATALLERGGPQQRAQLGLLALLGPEVEVDWWRRASDRLGAGPVEGAIVEILADGLATLSPSGDLHVRTAAALAWSARAEERALAHEALASTAGAATPRVLHLLRAGRIEPCWEEIWDAVATATAQSVPRALLLLGEFEEAVRRGGIPDGHPRVLQVRRLEGRVFDSLGRLSQGLQRVGRLLEGARSHADAVGEADCLADQAHFEMRFGRVHRASALCDEATAAAERVGDADLRDRVRYRRAVLEVLARRAAVARPAIDGVRVSSHPYAQTRVHLLDGRLAWDSGDAIAARGHFEHALAAATRAGDARGVLMAELLLGGLAVAADDVLGARAWFRSAQRRSIAADDVASLARARAGLVRCALREDDEGAAERLLVPLAEKAAEGVDADLSILVAAAVAARHEDPPPEAWAVLERLEADGYADVEMADVLRIAARRAERAGAVARAHALLARAARHGTNPSQDRRELSRDAR